MQWKSEPPKPVTAEGKDLPDFILHVNIPELKELSARDKYSAHLIFIALSVLLLIGIGLLPKSPVPVSVQGLNATVVSFPASASTQTTQTSLSVLTIKATLTAAKAP